MVIAFKKAIEPIQMWFLSQGRCVGCGTSLEIGSRKKHKKGTMVTCKKCGRIFIQDIKSKNYRRALLSEV